MNKLSHDIVEHLAKKLGRNKKTVMKDIYLLQRSYPNLTKNALAQIYAQKHGQTVYRKLDKEDKATLPSTEVVPEKLVLKSKTKRKKPVLKKLFEYETSDHFIKGHIKQLNIAFTAGCYTAVFILLRKIVENLIIDILRAKYPDNKKQNKELYYDIAQNRFKDFGVILKNFYDKSSDFDTEKKAVERLYDLAKNLKDDANDKTHSWFHLVEKEKEVTDLNAEQIIELIKKLEKAVGIRK